ACLGFNLEIVSGSVSQFFNPTVVICGTVNSYLPSNGLTPGLLTVSGQVYTVAPGAALTGTALLIAGANLTICINATENSQGQIISGAVTTSSGGAVTTTVCGVVTQYIAPTGDVSGLITISGVTYPIAPHTSLIGGNVITSGTNVCLQFTLNSTGQITGGGAVFNGSVQISVCGTVSSFTDPTAFLSGSITIAGISFPVAASTVFSGGSFVVPATLGMTLTLNGQGQVTAAVITASSCTSTTITGPVTAFSPATATTPGSITINGVTYSVAVGTVLIISNGLPLSARPYRIGPRRPDHAMPA
ncbi:MAG: hypothetical protein ACRDFX_08880, partial [Chloroflexota bacterium]